MNIVRVLVASLSLAFLFPASAQPAPERFMLQFGLTLGSEPALTPDMIVAEGTEGVIELVTDQGEGIQLHALAERSAHPQGKPGQWVSVSIQIVEQRAQGSLTRATPIMLVPLHEPNAIGERSVEPGGMTIADESGKPIVELSLTASRADKATKLGGKCGGGATAASAQPAVTPMAGGDRCCTRCSGYWVCCTASCCSDGRCGCCSNL